MALCIYQLRNLLWAPLNFDENGSFTTPFRERWLCSCCAWRRRFDCQTVIWFLVLSYGCTILVIFDCSSTRQMYYPSTQHGGIWWKFHMGYLCTWVRWKSLAVVSNLPVPSFTGSRHMSNCFWLAISKHECLLRICSTKPFHTVCSFSPRNKQYPCTAVVTVVIIKCTRCKNCAHVVWMLLYAICIVCFHLVKMYFLHYCKIALNKYIFSEIQIQEKTEITNRNDIRTA